MIAANHQKNAAGYGHQIYHQQIPHFGLQRGPCSQFWTLRNYYTRDKRTMREQKNQARNKLKKKPDTSKKHPLLGAKAMVGVDLYRIRESLSQIWDISQASIKGPTHGVITWLKNPPLKILPNPILQHGKKILKAKAPPWHQTKWEPFDAVWFFFHSLFWGSEENKH